MKKQYTYDECYEIALQCKNKMDMHNKNIKHTKQQKIIIGQMIINGLQREKNGVRKNAMKLQDDINIKKIL